MTAIEIGTVCALFGLLAGTVAEKVSDSTKVWDSARSLLDSLIWLAVVLALATLGGVVLGWVHISLTIPSALRAFLR